MQTTEYSEYTEIQRVERVSEPARKTGFTNNMTDSFSACSFIPWFAIFPFRINEPSLLFLPFA